MTNLLGPFGGRGLVPSTVRNRQKVINLLGPLGGRGLVPSTALVWRTRTAGKHGWERGWHPNAV